MIAHGLNVEQGGRAAEMFVYGWCPCGWTQEERPGEFTSDRIKRAFLRHLKSSSPDA